jgi:hypothetical protein
MPRPDTPNGQPRSRLGGAAFAVLVAAGFVVPPAASANAVRVFAVGNRIRISDFVTYQSFRDKMFAMVDSSYPNRASLVQAGVDDVASHVQPLDPFAPADVLANFPESVALPAAFIGTRGASARNKSNSAQAFIALNTTYAPQIASYKAKFGLYDQADFTRLIVLAVTDTVYRAFFETFRDIAMAYGIYVTAGADVPPATKVYQDDDPITYAEFIDPAEEGVRPYAYVATSPDPVNSTFLFQPDGEVFVQSADGTPGVSPSGTGGEILGSTTKVYLTPIELTLLKLADGPIDRLNVLDTPIGRLGIVISKDAWMVDVNDRLAARHAHMMIQSEAFSSWGFQTDPWDPDVFKQGGFNHLQQHQTRVLNVDPSMVGNLLEITFDGQSSLLGRRTKTDPGALDGSNAWIGQNPDTGFLAVAPWIVSDPGISSPGLSLADRRAALAVDGAKLLPGSGVTCATPLSFGPCENGYREAVVWADVEVPDGIDVLTAPDPTPPSPTDYGASIQVNSDDSGSPSSQLYPQMAAEGDSVFLVWQDTRHGHDNVYAAFSADAGTTWSPEVHVSDNPSGTVVEMLPEIAVHRDPATDAVTVYVVWQELAAGTGLEDGRIMLARFDETLARVDDADARVDDVDGAGKWHPVVVATGKRGNPLVAWVDERDAGPRQSIFEQLYAAKGRGRRGHDSRPTLRFSKARKVVREKDVDTLARQLANEWAPAITYADRRVVLGWLDFRQYNWDVYSSYSRNGLRYARSSIRVDDSPDFERLNSHPSLAYDEVSGRLILVWADQREREVDTNIFSAVSTDGGVTWSAPARLDSADLVLDPGTEIPSNQWQPEIAARAGRACVAWQDGRLGNNDIFAVVSTDGGGTFSADERVDDSQGGGSEQFSPTTAVGAGRCYVAWSDDRSGDADIRFASRLF